MDADTDKSQIERIIDLFLEHGVQFVVIGGQAELLFGSARVTFDTDLCYRRTRENLEKLAAALAELKPSLRDAPADLPFRLDAKSLALGYNFLFRTNEGDLDLIGSVEPLGTTTRSPRGQSRCNSVRSPSSWRRWMTSSASRANSAVLRTASRSCTCKPSNASAKSRHDPVRLAGLE